ncbi:T-cell surface glycoprotein CD1a-like isoform X2 [Erinaceus europaeus]|uniref:T-cell surface glycoprotein CD1a-like isoform X2 n=1 Tax=Erinaceus europaeus TaxID=9365 RepID=A0ABM3XY18_ERIEU|nr:T-cell surface glycoprotein CD1a-like isoform X2 [Erinaceus europaeus]
MTPAKEMLFLQLPLLLVLLPGGNNEDGGNSGNYPDPFEIQIAAGCEWHFGEDLVNFIRIAYDGSDLLSYQNNSWVPSPKGGSRAQQVWELLEKSKISQEITDGILPDICPRLLLSLLDAGKADLQRQVKPKAWLSSGRTPGPGRLLLVCHISGFHPKPVWAVWTRGKQEQPSMQRSDVLPHVDHTWYLRVTLEVAAGEAVGLACRVRHSSLGGQDLLLYWEQNHSKDLTILAVMVPLVLLKVGLLFWSRKYWKCCGLQPSSSFPLE